MDDTLKVAMYEWGQDMLGKLENDGRIIDPSEAKWKAWMEELAKVQVRINGRIAVFVTLTRIYRKNTHSPILRQGRRSIWTAPRICSHCSIEHNRVVGTLWQRPRTTQVRMRISSLTFRR